MPISIQLLRHIASPPWIFAAGVCCINAFHAGEPFYVNRWNGRFQTDPDKTGERFFHHTMPPCGVIVGYIIAVSTPSIGGRYMAMFLLASGYAGAILISSKHLLFSI